MSAMGSGDLDVPGAAVAVEPGELSARLDGSGRHRHGSRGVGEVQTMTKSSTAPVSRVAAEEPCRMIYRDQRHPKRTSSC